MDIELFSNMVSEVLRRDGAVVLPDLGCLYFVTCPASFSDRGFTLNPPYRKLVFSMSERQSGNGNICDATALAKLYAGANSVSMSVAQTAVSRMVATVSANVSSSRDFDLPGLGKFRRMRDGTLFFVQNQDCELCPAYDHLTPVSLKSLEMSGKDKTVMPDNGETVMPAVDETIMPTAEETSVTAHPSGKASASWVFIVILIIVLTAGIALGLLAILGRNCPELVDPLLYNAEQLDIINMRF